MHEVLQRKMLGGGGRSELLTVEGEAHVHRVIGRRRVVHARRQHLDCAAALVERARNGEVGKVEIAAVPRPARRRLEAAAQVARRPQRRDRRAVDVDAELRAAARRHARGCDGGQRRRREEGEAEDLGRVLLCVQGDAQRHGAGRGIGGGGPPVGEHTHECLDAAVEGAGRGDSHVGSNGSKGAAVGGAVGEPRAEDAHDRAAVDWAARGAYGGSDRRVVVQKVHAALRVLLAVERHAADRVADACEAAAVRVARARAWGRGAADGARRRVEAGRHVHVLTQADVV